MIVEVQEVVGTGSLGDEVSFLEVSEQVALYIRETKPEDVSEHLGNCTTHPILSLLTHAVYTTRSFSDGSELILSCFVATRQLLRILVSPPE